MQTQPKVVWRGIEPTETLSQRIDEELVELHRAYPRITACRVAIESPHRHHRHGGHYQVKIEVTVPGKQLTVTRDPAAHKNFEDAHAAVNEAFATMHRQLSDYLQLVRGEVKRHVPAAQEGEVLRVMPEEDCGFIATRDGSEVYFHKNSVLNGGWQRIAAGDRVRFHAEQGDKGPQASTVHLVAHKA